MSGYRAGRAGRTPIDRDGRRRKDRPLSALPGRASTSLARDPRGAAVPEGRLLGLHGDLPASGRRGRPRRVPGRRPRHGIVGRCRRGRVQRPRVARPRENDRVARRAGLVERKRRDVGHLVLGLQRPPDGSPAASGAEGDHPDLRHRPAVHRRRPLWRRRPARDRHPRLPDVHGRVQRAATGSVRLRRGMARGVAATDRGQRAVAAALARTPERGRVLASRLEHRRVRSHRGGHARDRRTCRRLSEHGVPCLRTTPRSEADPVRTVGALEPARIDAGAAHRPRAGDDRLVGPMAPRGPLDRHGSRDRDLRPTLDRARARRRYVRRRVASRAGLAAGPSRRGPKTVGERGSRGGPAVGRRAADPWGCRCDRLDLVRGVASVRTPVGPASG